MSRLTTVTASTKGHGAGAPSAGTAFTAVAPASTALAASRLRAAERDGGVLVSAAERAAAALRGSGCRQRHHPRCGGRSPGRPAAGILVGLD